MQVGDIVKFMDFPKIKNWKLHSDIGIDKRYADGKAGDNLSENKGKIIHIIDTFVCVEYQDIQGRTGSLAIPQNRIKLVEPKQEQYYTSIPTDVKVGDKFELAYTKSIGKDNNDMDVKWCSDRGFKIGDIVSLKHNDNTSCPNFENKGKTLYLDWGWLKPVKDEYKVGDWVQLVDRRFSDHVDAMDKFKGTIQQITSLGTLKSEFIIQGWTFSLSDFVKKVDAPVVTNSKLSAGFDPVTFLGRNSSENTDVQQFNIGDEVELLSVPTKSKHQSSVGSRGLIININPTYGFNIQFVEFTYWCKAEQIKLINKSNNNGKVHSNNNPTRNQGIALHGIPASIICGTTPRGKTISCSRAEIKLGN